MCYREDVLVQREDAGSKIDLRLVLRFGQLFDLQTKSTNL